MKPKLRPRQFADAETFSGSRCAYSEESRERGFEPGGSLADPVLQFPDAQGGEKKSFGASETADGSHRGWLSVRGRGFLGNAAAGFRFADAPGSGITNNWVMGGIHNICSIKNYDN
jgi:hypothetical protein